MSTKRQCLECKHYFSIEASHCKCGWKAPKTSQTANRDHRCEYVGNRNRRCPLPGTMCPFPYADGPWYCSGHWRSIGDPKLGEAVLINAEKNYHKIMDKLEDWRRKLPHNL